MQTPTRVLIVKLSSLGDLFHALPVAHMLREQMGAVVDWVTQPEYVDLVGCFSDVEHVCAYPRKSFFRDFSRFASELRRVEYDVVIDLQGLMKSALVARSARTARRIGPAHNREGAALMYDETAKGTSKKQHAVDVQLDVARHLGLDTSDIVFPLRFPGVELNGSTRRVGMVPCSRWTAKNWPAERFVEVGKALIEQKDATVYLFGSPDDAEACAAMAEHMGDHAINLCGDTSLVELGSHLQKMDLLISVDSGPMHMAAALDVPVLALFAATDPGRTGPYGEKHRVIEPEGWTDEDRQPRAFKQASNPAMLRIDVDRVVEAALEILA